MKSKKIVIVLMFLLILSVCVNVFVHALEEKTIGNLNLEIIDGIVKEPLGGAHNDYDMIGKNLQDAILKSINELKNEAPEKLKQERYNKFRRMGVFCQ